MLSQPEKAQWERRSRYWQPQSGPHRKNLPFRSRSMGCVGRQRWTKHQGGSLGSFPAELPTTESVPGPRARRNNPSRFRRQIAILPQEIQNPERDAGAFAELLIEGEGPVTPLDRWHACQHARRSHLILYPFCQRNVPAPERLSTAQRRSNSMTDHTHRQPRGGACFMTAM